MGALLSSEDEPEEFEWDRLAELQRRNSLCLPHLRSCYPLEVIPKPAPPKPATSTPYNWQLVEGFATEKTVDVNNAADITLTGNNADTTLTDDWKESPERISQVIGGSAVFFRPPQVSTTNQRNRHCQPGIRRQKLV